LWEEEEEEEAPEVAQEVTGEVGSLDIDDDVLMHWTRAL
jgi:hypothetical protein